MNDLAIIQWQQTDRCYAMTISLTLSLMTESCPSIQAATANDLSVNWGSPPHASNSFVKLHSITHAWLAKGLRIFFDHSSQLLWPLRDRAIRTVLGWIRITCTVPRECLSWVFWIRIIYSHNTCIYNNYTAASVLAHHSEKSNWSQKYW